MRKHWRLYVFMAGFVYGILTLASCDKPCECEGVSVSRVGEGFGNWTEYPVGTIDCDDTGGRVEEIYGTKVYSGIFCKGGGRTFTGN